MIVDLLSVLVGLRLSIVDGVWVTIFFCFVFDINVCFSSTLPFVIFWSSISVVTIVSSSQGFMYNDNIRVVVCYSWSSCIDCWWFESCCAVSFCFVFNIDVCFSSALLFVILRSSIGVVTIISSSRRVVCNGDGRVVFSCRWSSYICCW